MYPRSTSCYFPYKSKGYMFYCPYQGTKIVESFNVNCFEIGDSYEY